MKTPHKPNCAFVSVVCDFDYYQCAMQLLSAQRLFHDDYKSYYVVLNGYDNEALKKRLESVLAPLLTADFSSKLIFVASETLWSHGKQKQYVALQGWFAQQTLKLEIAKRIREAYYIILDAKNFFIRNSSFQDFFTVEGKPIMWRRTWGNGTPQRRYAFDYFGLNSHFETGFSNTTPYIMVTEVVKDLLTELQAQGVSLVDLIHTNKTYEFFLYEAFLIKQNRLNAYFLDEATEEPEHSAKRHGTRSTSFQASYARRLFRGDTKNADLVRNTCMDIITSPSVKVFGIHRGMFPKLSKSEQQIIGTIVTSGCLSTEEWKRFFAKQRRVARIHETERGIRIRLRKLHLDWLRQGVFLLCRALALRL